MALVSSTKEVESSRPLCSICIANYNGIGIIERCIDSVLGQDTEHPFEIIVHDDASTDDSVALLRARYPEIKLLTTSTNLGFCRSNNRMAEHARGRYLLFLNNDAALHPDALKTLSDYSVSHGFWGILSLSQYDMRSGSLLDTGSIFDPFLNPVPNRNPAREDVAMVMGACLWIPRFLWDEIGGFPVWFDSFAEDLYLCCAAWCFGYQVKALSQSGYDHLVGGSFGGGKVDEGRLRTTKRRRALSERNKLYAMITFYPAALLIPMLPLYLASFTLEGFVMTLLKRDPSIWIGIYWSCICSAWQERKTLLSERASVQAKRHISLTAFLKLFTPYPYKLRMLLRYGIPELT